MCGGTDMGQKVRRGIELTFQTWWLGLITYLESTNGRCVPVDVQIPIKRENTQWGRQHKRKMKPALGTKRNCSSSNSGPSPQSVFFFNSSHYRGKLLKYEKMLG